MQDARPLRRIQGSCHCGNLRFTFDWPGPPGAIPVRACGCTLCRKHGAIWTSHPDGRVAIAIADEARLLRYRFGTRTADFHVCLGCGVVPAVTCEIDGSRYAVVNANTFDGVDRSELIEAATDFEGETCHKRVLRFLNLHYRAVHRILQHVDAIEVDFHNQRLHCVVAKPYGNEASRIYRGVAIGQMLIDVLQAVEEENDHEIIPAAKVRVGIDSGIALAVRKKVTASLIYPSVLIVLVVLLMVFLVTYVVPTFATLYSTMQASLPAMTVWLIAIGTAARSYIVFVAGALVGGIFLFRWWARGEAARERIDRVKLRIRPPAGRASLRTLWGYDIRVRNGVACDCRPRR